MGRTPIDKALQGQVGDEIRYEWQGEIKRDTISGTEWVKIEKGGKVYSYVMNCGDIVANDLLVELIPHGARLEIPVSARGLGDFSKGLSELSEKQEIAGMVSKSNLAPSYKVAICCILDETPESLRVAADLIRMRARQLEELDIAKFSVPNQQP